MQNLLKTTITAAAIVCAGAVWAENHTSEFVEEQAVDAKSFAGEKGYVAPVAAAHMDKVHRTRLIYVHRSERLGPAPLHVVPGCPPRWNGMFRGNMYCINGRPID